MPTLICKRVKFYSEEDELAFFGWLKKIKAVSRIDGVGDQIRLEVGEVAIADESLRELIAVFTRYGVERSQLAQFKNNSNEEWFFCNRRAFWRKAVFKNEECT